MAGQKAGWAEELVARTASGGVTVRTRVHLEVRRRNATMTLEISDSATYAPLPDGRLLSFEMREGAGEAVTVHWGEARNGGLHVRVRAGGAEQVQDLPATRERLQDTLPLLTVRRLRAEGGTVALWRFDRQLLRAVPADPTLAGEKETRIQGVPVRVLTVRSVDRERGIVMTARVTDTGRTLETQLGPGLRLVLEDRAVAQNKAVSVPDLYTLSVVPVDRKLGTASEIRALRLRLTGLPAGLTLNDARQRLSGDVLEVRRVSSGEGPAVVLTPDERTRWLAATPFVDHRAPAIRQLADRVGQDGSLGDRLRRATRLVHRALSYTLDTAPASASAILAAGRGDCTEYSRVLTAVVRALGLPAREVSGMAYVGDADPGFAFHAWTEVHDGHAWLALDPTWDEAPVDATHVTLGREDPTAIVGVLGGLKLSVLAVER